MIRGKRHIFGSECLLQSLLQKMSMGAREGVQALIVRPRWQAPKVVRMARLRCRDEARV